MELAIGTGFLYKKDNNIYLITNGHCVTGVNPETNTRLSDNAGFPTTLEANIKTIINNPTTHHNYVDMTGERLKIKLYTDEDYTQPYWLVHPVHGYNIDVVAIPLGAKEDLPYHLAHFTLNTTFKAAMVVYSHEAPLRIAEEVFILGYPFGITDPFELPIWKRGSIATEPSMLYKGLPAMLVDTATREGMSGSPVILMRRGPANSGMGGVYYDNQGENSRFIGIYSGRIGSVKQGSDAQLGIVWKKEVIEEIIAGGKTGTIEFQNV